MYDIGVVDMIHTFLSIFQISTNALAALVKMEVPALISTIATHAYALLDSQGTIAKGPSPNDRCLEVRNHRNHK